ncbi:hypothetical protein [Brevundimonas sp.]|uniref:hypothetical protein n=1 Tax=Brevundimonas sp. TaxID=1871086 RepID=UPI0012282626|nr:hypothetical protein [Brevundimonas sp.]TAJ64654.1 MAG: hypothetical protein EPO49_04715 [Brevundimonas sp.]
MGNADTELQRLRELAPAAEIWTEGGQAVAFLPDVEFRVGKETATRDLLLWPRDRDSYNSRLFLSEPVTAANAKNWKTFGIFGRTWHACSWQGVPNTLPWIEILANHLRAFQ